MIWHNIFFEHITKYDEWRQEPPKMRKSGDRGTKSEPKGTKSEPKGSQRQVNGSQNSTKIQPNGAQRVPKVDHWKTLRKRDAFPAICQTILGAIFHEKCIQKSMQKSMTKKYGNVSENVSKMMPKRCPKSVTNPWNFGTCDFLFFVKGITLKSFFTWTGVPTIFQKSV